MGLTAEQQFAFINIEIGEADLLKNMQLLYILAKKIIIAIDHLLNGVLIRHKFLKYTIKLLKKILKLLNTFNAYFDPTEKEILLKDLYYAGELDEFEDQFLQKIDFFLKVAVKKKKQGPTEIIDMDDHTEEKKQFIDKLPESVKKARLEAERTSFNEFDHKKDQFKEDIKVINEDLKELLRKHDICAPSINTGIRGLLDKLYSNKIQPLLNQSVHKPSKDKDEFNEALFGGIENNSIIVIEKPNVKAAKVIQRFWRNLVAKKKNKEFNSTTFDIKIAKLSIQQSTF
jgi:hypothetical protein